MVRISSGTENNIRIFLSTIIVLGYFALLFVIIMVESSDTFNMKAGENSFMDIIKILIGVLTTIVAKIVFFWFDPSSAGAEARKMDILSKEDQETKELPKKEQVGKEFPKTLKAALPNKALPE